MLLLIALAAFCSTFLGGFFALRLRDSLHLILGFSAGAVMGVAFFDLLPAAIELSRADFSASGVTAVAALGFALYLVLDRFIVLHRHHEATHAHAHWQRGIMGAGALSLHSFLDGLGLGLAFKVSPSLGLVVALAVLAHDFSDGINTVSVILRRTQERARAFRWLLIDAIAPVVGVVASLFFSVSQGQLAISLALFSGFFLYIGASDLLPESHHEHPVWWTTLSTILGMFLLFAVVRVAGM